MEPLLNVQKMFWEDEKQEFRVNFDVDTRAFKQAMQQAALRAQEASRKFHEFNRQVRKQERGPL